MGVGMGVGVAADRRISKLFVCGRTQIFTKQRQRPHISYLSEPKIYKKCMSKFADYFYFAAEKRKRS